MRQFLFVSLITLSSCSFLRAVDQKYPELDNDKIYADDIKVCVSAERRGECFADGTGVLVAPKKEKYEFELLLPGQADYVTLETTHRWNRWEKDSCRDSHCFRTLYEPTAIENEDSSVVTFKAFDEKGRHSSALVAFEDPRYDLLSDIECDGKKWKSTGVAICESKIGLKQRITFSVPVNYESSTCPGVMETKDKKTYTLMMPRDVCNFVFFTKDEPTIKSRIITKGVDEFPVRK